MPKQSSFTSTNSKMGGIPQYEKGGLVKAGAGRGGQGGPTGKQLDDYERKQNAGIFTAGMKVPKNDDMGSMKRK
jgi:hypothetical protein